MLIDLRDKIKDKKLFHCSVFPEDEVNPRFDYIIADCKTSGYKAAKSVFGKDLVTVMDYDYLNPNQIKDLDTYILIHGICCKDVKYLLQRICKEKIYAIILSDKSRTEENKNAWTKLRNELIKRNHFLISSFNEIYN
jgi:hypothetical protein